MRTIDIFVQTEGGADILVITADPIRTLKDVLATMASPIALQPDHLVFMEEVPAHIDPDSLVEELLPLVADDAADPQVLRVHISRCRQIEVSVRFNNDHAKRRFSPNATVGRVHHWAARHAFGLTPRDAAEHVLQLQGTTKRPDLDVQIGTLTQAGVCAVAFDLVPRKRVEG